MGRRNRLKPCEACEQLVDTRYRIQYDATQTWKLVCLVCWQRFSQDNPLYRYGGTWKGR